MAGTRRLLGAAALLLVMLASGAAAAMDGDASGRHQTCRHHKCGKGRRCKMHKGHPRCFRRRPKKHEEDNACHATLCAPGYSCHLEAGLAVCVDVCSAVRCRDGYHCELNRRAKPECVRDEEPNPCIFTTCFVGTFCRKNENGAAECVSNCATVRCFPGTECRVDVDTGHPQCVRKDTKSSKSASGDMAPPGAAAFEAILATEGITRKANGCNSSCCKKKCQCRKKRCGRWAVCEVKGGKAKCKSLCSMFRCPFGLKCKIGAQGPMCVSRCSGCCNNRCSGK